MTVVIILYAVMEKCPGAVYFAYFIVINWLIELCTADVLANYMDIMFIAINFCSKESFS